VLLSLIIPAYNSAEYLSEAADSVLSQLPAGCELILVDDGSEDDTSEIMRGYERRFDNVKAALPGHGGVSAARNAGLDMAEGEWVTFMDSDDCLKEGFFGKVMPIRDDADLHIFSFERVEPAESGESVQPFALEDREYRSAGEFADEYIRSRHLLVYSACNKFYRRAILEEHGIRFREGIVFGEDRLFNYDYLRWCGGVVTSSAVMFRYMQRNPKSASKADYDDQYSNVMMLHKAKMECFLALSEECSEEEKRAFEEYDLQTELSRLKER